MVASGFGRRSVQVAGRGNRGGSGFVGPALRDTPVFWVFPGFRAGGAVNGLESGLSYCGGRGRREN
jgi:hypothetical protein